MGTGAPGVDTAGLDFGISPVPPQSVVFYGSCVPWAC
jgi:hypothetical protein